MLPDKKLLEIARLLEDSATIIRDIIADEESTEEQKTDSLADCFDSLAKGSTLVELAEDPEEDLVGAMEDYISQAMGGMGVEAVEFVDEDGSVSHTIDCKPNLKFIP